MVASSALTGSSPVLLWFLFQRPRLFTTTESTRVESKPAVFECEGAVQESIALALANQTATALLAGSLRLDTPPSQW